jgi:hypothetical protein
MLRAALDKLITDRLHLIYSLVDLSHYSISCRRNDGVALDFLVGLRIFPDVIQSGKGKEHATLQLEIMLGKGSFAYML